MNTREGFDKVYEAGKVPWVFKDPPKELAELIERGKIKPCNTLEVGCGEGWYSIYLASKGFQVTGIDWSEKAIGLAKENSKRSNISCDFLVMDIKNLNNLKERFDFIFDWRFLHDIVDESARKRYSEGISKLLNPKGKYLSTSFSEKSDLFGTGKFRRNPKFGIDLFFASMEDMENLFKPYFKIEEKKIIKLPEVKDGEKKEIFANYIFMSKKVIPNI